MANPTPEQQNEAGYTTKTTGDGKRWWSVDGINWYKLTEYYHEDEEDK